MCQWSFALLFYPWKVLYPAYPFLVLSTLGHGWMCRDVACVCAGVCPPQVDPHLQVAHHHPHHGHEVGHQEEHDVVPLDGNFKWILDILINVK